MIFDIQKASLLKRVSALILDIILVMILTVGAAWLIAEITDYDGYSTKLEEHYTKYENAYGITFDISDEEYAALSDEDRSAYDAARDALTNDQDAIQTLTIMMNLTLVIVSIGIFISVLILDFVVPLILKNGQTVGKKVFGIAVIRQDGVRMTSLQLFVRTILGKYTIEIMVPVLIIIMIYFGTLGFTGTLVIFMMCLLQLILTFATRYHTPIHDLLAATVTVDMSSQMIFDSTEELIEFKKRAHAEDVKKRER